MNCQECNKCNLNSPKGLPWGAAPAKVMFIGLNPAQTIKGDRLCFQSRSFKVLFRILAELGLNSENYYYTNLVKCATPENRNPKKHEIANCDTFLQAEIDAVQPVKIIALGRFVASTLGLPKEDRKIIYRPNPIEVFCVYHPSFVTRFPANYEKFKTNLRGILK
jgi:uracil-DNA glycosylase family 4